MPNKIPRHMHVASLLRKRNQQNVLRYELWTKNAKYESVGEVSHEVAMLLGAFSGLTACPNAEQSSALRRCYKALTGQKMPPTTE